MDNKYCYEGTDILKNKLNIKNDEKLYEVERKLTALRTKDLYKKPVKGDFDLEHLKKIHKHIFQDIYEWAGEIRDVDIAKSNLFCLTQYIDTFANEIFTGLKKENHLKDLDKEEFSKRCAYYFCEINALHPFREGNAEVKENLLENLL